MATGARIQQAQAFITDRFGYTVKNLALVEEAKDASGYLIPESNKRLAIVGDKALEAALANAWYPTGTPRGAYSEHSRSLLSDANLGTVARRIGLGDQLILNPGHVGDVSAKTLATALEAVFGAIYRDCGGDVSIISAAMTAIGIDIPGVDANNNN